MWHGFYLCISETDLKPLRLFYFTPPPLYPQMHLVLYPPQKFAGQIAEPLLLYTHTHIHTINYLATLVLVAAHGIFSCSMRDLILWLGTKLGTRALGAQSLGHWTTSEVPWNTSKKFFTPYQKKVVNSVSLDPHPNSPTLTPARKKTTLDHYSKKKKKIRLVLLLSQLSLLFSPKLRVPL